jgi:hypothetical protein
VLNTVTMKVTLIIRDVTSVTATIWNITIRDKPNNSGLACAGGGGGNDYEKRHPEPNRNKNLNDGNTAVDCEL